MIKRRSIRAKMAALVIIPLVALLGLWLLATALTVGPARNLADAGLFARAVGNPAARVVAELQTERRLTVVLLARPGSATATPVQRTATDTAIVDFRRLSADPQVAQRASGLVRQRIGEFTTQLDALGGARAAADQTGATRNADSRAAVMVRYTRIIDSAYRLFAPLAEVQDPQLSQLSRTLIGLSRARELVAQEDTLVSAVASAGKLTISDVTDIAGAIGAQRQLSADASAELPETDRRRYVEMVRGDAFVQLAGMEQALLAKGQPGRSLPVNTSNWRTAADTVMKALRSFEEQAAAAPARRADAAVSAAYTRIAAAGAAGLLSVMLALWVGLQVSRSVGGRLMRLRDTARDLAQVELPSVVARLRRGERVEVEDAELHFGADEIGEVGEAFAQVRSTAVRAAVDEAVLRHGLNEVFLNVARRSQTLLHRQLSLLDRMERRARDPQELEDLFRLDHLSTRMRRHAEDLVILAGGAPGRGWRHPVAAVDVIRGAVSEIEEYVRVAVDKVPDVAIAGRAVGDIIHLLAELVENGTSFSPPQTRVQVGAQIVATGLAVQIEDRGLGMTPEAVEEANARLAVPPDFDPANSARLGLMVVGRLAARHGITVELSGSSYGGVTARVVIPQELISAAPKAEARSGPAPKQRGQAPLAVPAGGAGTGALAVEDAAVENAETATEGAIASAKSGSVDIGGLPRRSRQNSEASIVEPITEAATPVAGRTPQRVRANLAAFQKGTSSGRASVVNDPPIIGDNGPSEEPGAVPGPSGDTGTAHGPGDDPQAVAGRAGSQSEDRGKRASVPADAARPEKSEQPAQAAQPQEHEGEAQP